MSELEYPWNFGSSSILEEVTVTSEYKLSTKVFKEKKSLSGRMTKVSPQHAGGWSTRHLDHDTPDVTNSGKCARMILPSLATRLVSKFKFLSSLEILYDSCPCIIH